MSSRREAWQALEKVHYGGELYVHAGVIRGLLEAAKLTQDDLARILATSSAEAGKLLEGERRLYAREHLWKLLQTIWRERRCSVEGCQDAVQAQGMCSGHLMQQRRHGVVGPKRGPHGRMADG